MTQSTDEGLLGPAEAIDLENCAREPIHIPGRIQPRGVLLVVRESDGRVVQCSTNVSDVVGLAPLDVIGAGLGEVLGPQDGTRLLDHAARHQDLAPHNPVEIRTGHGRTVETDAILHRPPLPDGAEPVVVIELEQAVVRPLSFPNTYQAVRTALADLDRASTLDALFTTAAEHVRRLTGFDRVMIYRFDADHNGEVVAEAKREDLNSFYGLHYPATDIPRQARALYEKNWIRLIDDVDYVPSDVVPTDLPTTGEPLDLTYSTLRSVSPIHLEYLRNMGVGASMSISLLRDGRLWGLIACHHYSGPHHPSYAVRAAAEFLGSALSVLLVAQSEEDRLVASRASSRLLAGLVADSRDEDTSLVEAMTADGRLLDLVDADGVVVLAEGRSASLGRVPDEEGVALLVGWLTGRLAETADEVVAVDSLRVAAPEIADLLPDVAGVLGVLLSDGQAVVWLRDEVLRSVDWGGDPHNKAIALSEGDTVRLSPRRSFDRWREVVSGHSEPWAEDAVESAGALRSHLVEALYLRGRRDVRAAEALQRSLLPATLPDVPGWDVTARYEPAGGGFVGGDWYDALLLPSGALALVVGDVTGHGLQAAASMGQIRNTLRAALVRAGTAQGAVEQLAETVQWTMPGQIATLVVAVVDLETGTVEYVTAGHPPPFFLVPGEGVVWGRLLGSPPLGLPSQGVVAGTTTIGPGGALVLYSDGLFERRDESLKAGLRRLAGTFAEHVGDVDAVLRSTRDPESEDDATLLVLRRRARDARG
ncbi:histidine kinase [Oerskovia sp. Root918]|uniref:SpoIIE family protein phosphatase n=1 Tax=Oerskovia sp. Root918 TaxID=1736607 RepID=UPI0006F6B95C|nr:SpoIIE family protein phosphatase [Oerskovia sp. Root918]KRD40709.1 histidine kinase [Oerskovia sp. Root918]